MKLSEAIRLGAMLRPQITGQYFRDGGSCAIGAALEATGYLYDENMISGAYSIFPILLGVARACPTCGLKFCILSQEILHLNDEHKWTRDRIADHVATLEASQDQPAPAVEVTALLPQLSPALCAVPLR